MNCDNLQKLEYEEEDTVLAGGSLDGACILFDVSGSHVGTI